MKRRIINKSEEIPIADVDGVIGLHSHRLGINGTQLTRSLILPNNSIRPPCTLSLHQCPMFNIRLDTSAPASDPDLYPWVFWD